MKKILLSIMAFSTCLGINAQNFSDDFESYTVGSYLGPQSAEWRTWSATGEGTTEDTKITDLQANSGTNSVYYSSTSTNGGPQDCVLDFINTHTTGVFTFQADFYVNTGKTAYFNFQANATIGNLYAMDVNMDNGNLQMQNSGELKLSTTYPQATWFTMTVECNLTTKIWELKMNGVSAGKWLNTVNSLRYVDIYPIMNSQFYVDNVSYTYAPYTVTNLNAAAADLNMGGNIATQVTTPKLKVVNAGTTTITSFTATLNYNGNNYPLPVTGISLASLSSTEIAFPSVTLTAGSNLAVATISNVNGATDDVPSDDMSSRMVNPVVPALGKMVVGEEGTGTWCQWCPRGAVNMDRFENDYSQFWAGIAVHNGDPMTNTTYDSGMSFSSFPSSKVDRVGAGIDPSTMTTPFFTRLQVAPTAFIEVGATYNSTTRELNVSGDFNFQSAATSNYKAAFVITEDGVTGTTGYSQSNAYAGGSNGIMGGFELLSNPVPASLMHYDHVARDIQPAFGGFTGSFPTTVASGDVLAVNHTFTLPANWNSDSLHIIVMLIAPNGQIDNAGKATIAEAVTNGFVAGTSTSGSGAGIAEIDQIDATFQLYPNPASSNVNMTFNLKQDSKVELSVLDLSGKVLANRAYGNMNGASTIQYNSSELAQGIYLVEVAINGEKMTRRLVIQ
ncbi:MAG: T9SS type A sorting domain-containing protein [Crocinitomicaceae bacterium]